jgi:hypothetical protein
MLQFYTGADDGLFQPPILQYLTTLHISTIPKTWYTCYALSCTGNTSSSMKSQNIFLE